MSWAAGIFQLCQQKISEARLFHWHQIGCVKNVGQWPLVPRAAFTAIAVLCICSATLIIPALLSPEIAEHELALAENLKQKALTLQTTNTLLAAQQLEQIKQDVFSGAVLQHISQRVTDITQTLELVQAAAIVSHVQLLSVEPEIATANNTTSTTESAQLRMRARLTLPSLSVFWQQLSGSTVFFVPDYLHLESSEKPGVFDLSLVLNVQIGANFKGGETVAVAPLISNKTTSEPAKIRSIPKGFIQRAGGLQFLYVVTDEKGHLTRATSK